VVNAGMNSKTVLIILIKNWPQLFKGWINFNKTNHAICWIVVYLVELVLYIHLFNNCRAWKLLIEPSFGFWDMT